MVISEWPPTQPLRGWPPKGAVSPFGTAGRDWMLPPRSLRSLPPKGVQENLGRPGVFS